MLERRHAFTYPPTVDPKWQCGFNVIVNIDFGDPTPLYPGKLRKTKEDGNFHHRSTANLLGKYGSVTVLKWYHFYFTKRVFTYPGPNTGMRIQIIDFEDPTRLLLNGFRVESEMVPFLLDQICWNEGMPSPIHRGRRWELPPQRRMGTSHPLLSS
jgi:hypothetical protein